MPLKPEVCDYFVAAIKKRLFNLTAVSVETLLGAIAKTTDPEENLRQVMVVHYPKIFKQDIGSANLAIEKILPLAEYAMNINDLRFFDAYNCIYEACLQKIIPEKNLWRSFLKQYLYIMESMVDILQNHKNQL